jgi:hypothetical protein
VIKKKTKSDLPSSETPGDESQTINPIEVLESIFGGKEK